MNRVPGEPLFLKDLNCHCIDPNKDFVLNPKAWSDPAPGEWGTAAAFYSDYRLARRPEERLSLGRSFRLAERVRLNVRAEFFNAFNRMVMPDPSTGNPMQTQTRDKNGVPTAGFGRINALSTGGARTSQLVARIQF